MSTVNEGSASFITLNFRDQTGAAVTPITARYRLDKAGAAVKAWTTFIPASSTHVLAITGAENSLLSADAETETMRVTVEWTYDTDKTGTTDTTYTVKGLTKWP